MNTAPLFPPGLDPWLLRFLTTAVHLIVVLAVAFVLLRLIRLLTDRLNRMLCGFTQSPERQKRAQTLSHMVGTVASSVLFVVTAMFVLEEVGINIAPLLAAAGIGGLAIGVGAQNLVRDIISGFFLMLEDQIRVGDVVKVGDKSGLVENLSLRVLTLRDFDGSVHMIPNGTITAVTNQTKDFSYAVLRIGVSYQADIDETTAVLTAVGTELRQDPQFAPDLLDNLEVVGVDEFIDTQVKLMVRIKTAPSKQWRVGRELRKRIKKAFEVHGIQMWETEPATRIELDLKQKERPDQAQAPTPRAS